MKKQIRHRIRLEFTAAPKKTGEYAFFKNAHFTILERMLEESFGKDGPAALKRWMCWSVRYTVERQSALAGRGK